MKERNPKWLQDYGLSSQGKRILREFKFEGADAELSVGQINLATLVSVSSGKTDYEDGCVSLEFGKMAGLVM